MFAKSLNSIFHLNPLLESNSIAKWTFFRQFATQSKYFNVAFFGSDNVSLPTLKALYEDSLKPDGVVNKLEVCSFSSFFNYPIKLTFYRIINMIGCVHILWKIKRKRKETQEVLQSIHITSRWNILQGESNSIQPSATNEVLAVLILCLCPRSMKEWTVPTQFLEHQYNIIVCASFGYFIPSSVLNLFEHSGINVHPSLLPKYRGPSPIISTLLNVSNISNKNPFLGRRLHWCLHHHVGPQEDRRRRNALPETSQHLKHNHVSRVFILFSIDLLDWLTNWQLLAVSAWCILSITTMSSCRPWSLRYRESSMNLKLGSIITIFHHPESDLRDEYCFLWKHKHQDVLNQDNVSIV